MKQSALFIFLLFSFFMIQTEARKIITIRICTKKSNPHHKFILPVLAATECTISLYALIPILIASLGNIQFCLPAEPEITVEKLKIE
jgi:hypothetical protein